MSDTEKPKYVFLAGCSMRRPTDVAANFWWTSSHVFTHPSESRDNHAAKIEQVVEAIQRQRAQLLVMTEDEASAIRGMDEFRQMGELGLSPSQTLQIRSEDGTTVPFQFTATTNKTLRRGVDFEVDEDAYLPPKIAMPPGHAMLACANALFSSKSVEHVFEPIVADYQRDMFKALAGGEGRIAYATIAVRNWIGFVLAVAVVLVTGIGKVIKAAKGS